MILPNKYVPISESLIGISSLILSVLSDSKMTIDELWSEFNKYITQTNILKNLPTYNKFALSINFMYLTKMINYTEEGMIFNENIKLENI